MFIFSCTKVTICWITMQDGDGAETTAVTSSAYIKISAPSTDTGKSFKRMLKRVLDRHEPCGTPIAVSSSSDVVCPPSPETTCFLLDMKEAISDRAGPRIP
ncbi:uncharacterized protein LOC126382426 isoform X2 [Pectinophora gossypiella]|uniref:uncharacterized protein LOC126366351 isoform X2 n=1 Tax=Pectinophora gossypiella TaxID=13191 RepID=UPI00214E7DB0|nr:uncharacterized protein LOC126366351 isoform X2 [Pectinophora gossypiella]XP_049877626.1 uncharacterized protein LOC126374893 isoform X2 [Pectinophora gossypiella]XP_049879618.1 uncharacterized protein LOC126376329 isoform X2 [Pectinophora gossypiella]XP_049886921.1 uncharacterized protein LOC126381479 isoform X2 [Pectinophora gossypiella]XP_049887686.1 uncharacterized protein LOC126382042 isoform X2 [Pectinophora gossypiella]XP_049888262.1 uncharacterized protein LOC126382426 isoform X2 [P